MRMKSWMSWHFGGPDGTSEIQRAGLDDLLETDRRRQPELAREGLHNVELLRVVLGHAQVQQSIKATCNHPRHQGGQRVRTRKPHVSVERFTWPEQGGLEQVGSVGGANHEHVSRLVDAVQLGEQLGYDPVHHA